MLSFFIFDRLNLDVITIHVVIVLFMLQHEKYARDYEPNATPPSFVE